MGREGTQLGASAKGEDLESVVTRQTTGDMSESNRPLPESFTLGEGIDWTSPLDEVFLYVELPFWLMTPPGSAEIVWSETTFTVDICSPWMEVFGDVVLDSRRSVIHHGPWRHKGWQPPEQLAGHLARMEMTWQQRPCKTVLRLAALAHRSALRQLSDSEPPRAQVEQEAYWASLCEAHVPVVNELIQRYRLLTYDYFAYEVSAWDVPVWYLKHADTGYRAVLLPYKDFDNRPVTVEKPDIPGGPSKVQQFEWTKLDAISTASSGDATPGEFDLLDARSLMERGDYTGAVRRTVTAVEAVLRWALIIELQKTYSPAEAEQRAKNTDNDFPGRLAQWRRLAHPEIGQQEFDEFQTTREIRHDIVHRGRRLTHQERGRAQRAVDTSRWLYNKIEDDTERSRLRDYETLKSVGRVALALRFPPAVDERGITLGPLS
jgi:hypothetical protein